MSPVRINQEASLVQKATMVTESFAKDIKSSLSSSNAKRIMGVVAVAAIAMGVFKLANWWRLDQITEVAHCPGESFSSYDVGMYAMYAEQNIAEYQYCLGKAYKNGCFDHKLQNAAAQELYLKATRQGFTLAKQELCRPSLYIDWPKELQIPGEYHNVELESFCCPPPVLGFCPWHQPVQDELKESGDDRSTSTGSVFGNSI